MPIKRRKPTTPGQRQMSHMDFSVLTKKKPEKRLLAPLKSKAGRNNQGRITVRHRGGGAKRKYRVIDLNRREKAGVPGKIASIEYDPNRNVYIGLIHYADGDKRYILIPHKVKVGFTVLADEKVTAQPGNRMCIKNIPEGVAIYNIELNPGQGGKIARSAGTSAKLASLEGKFAQVRLPSSEVRYINKECMASIGVLGNSEKNNIKLGKAGRSRYLGRRPSVRGKAMNPVDHPHGGGEGGCPIGLKNPKTPWGAPALGKKTRRNKRSNKFIIKSRKGR